MIVVHSHISVAIRTHLQSDSSILSLISFVPSQSIAIGVPSFRLIPPTTKIRPIMFAGPALTDFLFPHLNTPISLHLPHESGRSRHLERLIA